MGGINWTFPTLTTFFVNFYAWLIGGPFLFIALCVCAYGLIQLITTSGQRGVVPFVGAPVAVIVMYLLPTVFPALGTAV